MALAVGQQIWIPCKVQPGPFSDEPLVTIDSIDGPVTGFVNRDELKDNSFVRSIVRDIARDHVEIWIRGSFFTTNGLANISPESARAA